MSRCKCRCQSAIRKAEIDGCFRVASNPSCPNDCESLVTAHEYKSLQRRATAIYLNFAQESGIEYDYAENVLSHYLKYR